MLPLGCDMFKSRKIYEKIDLLHICSLRFMIAFK
jgi:hypothetical protein